MSYRMSCRRSIPAFTMTLLLTLPAAAVAAGPAHGGDREPAERGRLSLVLESLWEWLGLTPAPPASVAGTTTTEGANGTGTGGGTGGEGQGNYDPSGSGPPPPEYNPDLNPGGGTSGGG